MPQSGEKTTRRRRNAGGGESKFRRRGQSGTRYSVALPIAIATEVERYAETVNASMSKAITSLVRLGLESQENRKREFFKKLKQNLTEDDPEKQDRMVDEFRKLILGI